VYGRHAERPELLRIFVVQLLDHLSREGGHDRRDQLPSGQMIMAVGVYSKLEPAVAVPALDRSR